MVGFRPLAGDEIMGINAIIGGDEAPPALCHGIAKTILADGRFTLQADQQAQQMILGSVCSGK